MEDYESYYRPPPSVPEDSASAEPPHSGLGIASFAVAILSGVAEFAFVVVAGVMATSTPGGLKPESPQAVAIGLAIIGALGLAFIGMALAVAALFQPGRKKVFAVLGLMFNLFVLLGVCGLMGLGLAVG